MLFTVNRRVKTGGKIARIKTSVASQKYSLARPGYYTILLIPYPILEFFAVYALYYPV